MEEELWLLLMGLGAGGVVAAVNQRAMKAVATSYVWLTEAIGAVAIPVRDRWRRAVAEARQEREQQVARSGGSPRRTRRRHQQGHAVVTESAEVATEAAAV